MTRKEALRRLRMLHLVAEDPEDKVAILMAIKALKQPEQKQGKWIEGGEDTPWICSNCGVSGHFKFEYCPKCGAKMGEE